MVRSMPIDLKPADNLLWAEACSAAVYIRNRLPHSQLKQRTYLGDNTSHRKRLPLKCCIINNLRSRTCNPSAASAISTYLKKKGQLGASSNQGQNVLHSLVILKALIYIRSSLQTSRCLLFMRKTAHSCNPPSNKPMKMANVHS